VTSLIPIDWRPREPPLAALAAVALGDAAKKLGERLLAMGPDLERLKGVAGTAVLVVLGDSHLLPWVDGVVYLGRDERAPSLLLPVTLEPSVSPELLERAVLSGATARPQVPVALLADPPRLLSLAAARTIDAERLSAWQSDRL
jgi:MoxR-vWA-beta-propeller ternary system domain bpX5